jgi:hypothetical protein
LKILRERKIYLLICIEISYYIEKCLNKNKKFEIYKKEYTKKLKEIKKKGEYKF